MISDEALLTRIAALAEKWNSTPDYSPTEYDRGRVDQRHDMTAELFEALASLNPSVNGSLLPLAGCTCPHKELSSSGVFEGVQMGPSIVRTSTTEGCPHHDTCQGYTKAVRASRPGWSNPWCPIHATRDCPEVKP